MVRIFQYNTRTMMQAMEHGRRVLQREIEDNITYNLYVWRRMPMKRVRVLRRIQALKKFYLALYRYSGNERDFNDVNQLVRNILNVWRSNDEE